MDIAGQVLGVTGRSTRNGKTVYDVAFSDGNKYTTFDGPTAAKAQSLTGQQVSVRIEQNGQYFNLRDIAPSGQLPPMAMPAAPGTPIPNAPQPGIPMAPPSSDYQRSRSPEDEAKIVKQSSFATAFAFVGALYQGAGPETLEEAKATALALSKQLWESVLAQGPAQTPSAVADVINAEIPGAVQVGAPAPQTATVDW